MPNQSSLRTIWNDGLDHFSNRNVLLLPSGEWISYSDVDVIASALTVRLETLGVKPGDFVLLNLSYKASYLPAFLAVWSTGAVAVPAPPDIGQEKLLALANLCSSSLVDEWKGTGFPSFSGVRLSGSQRVEPYDYAYAMMTSGTSGKPKTCLISHRTAALVQRGVARAIGPMDGECFLHSASFSFSSSIRQMLQPIIAGGAIIFAGGTGGLDWTDIATNNHEQLITTVDLTPSQIRLLIELGQMHGAGPILPFLKRTLVASERLDPSILKKWREITNVSNVLYHLYGKTETGGVVSVRALSSSDEMMDVIPLSPPYSPLTMKLNSSGGHLYELLIGGLGKNDCLLTRENDGSIRVSQYDKDGWHETGDLFEVSEDNNLLFSGRIDRTVKFLGVSIDLDALELELQSKYPTCTFLARQVERADGGEFLLVAYHERDSRDPTFSQHLLKRAIWAIYPKLPVQVFALKKLPINLSGKTDRLVLERNFRECSAGELVTRIWREHTSPLANPIADSDADFFAEGGDSLSLISFLVALKDTTGTSLSIQDFLKQPTLQRVINLASGVSHQDVVVNDIEQIVPSFSRATSGFQEGVWISEQLTSPAGSQFWLSLECKVNQVVDVGDIENALQKMAGAFDIFRSAFRQTDDGELHWLSEHFDASDFVVALDHTSLASAPRYGMAEGSPLLQVRAHTSTTSTSIRISIHHAICDRISLERFVSLFFTVLDGSPVDMTQYHPRSIGLYADQRKNDILFLNEAKDHWSQVLGRSPDYRAARPASPEVRRLSSSVFFRRTNATIVGASRHSWWLSAFASALRVVKLPHSDLIGIDVNIRPQKAGKFSFGPFISSVPVKIPTSASDNVLPQDLNKAVLQSAQYASVSPQDLRLQFKCPTGVPSQPFFLYKMVYQKSAFARILFAGEEVSYSQHLDGIAANDMTLFVRESEDYATVDLAFFSNVIEETIAKKIIDETLIYIRAGMASED